MYIVKRKDTILATITEWYIDVAYDKIDIKELELIKQVAIDLIVYKKDFDDYSEFWINDYTLERR